MLILFGKLSGFFTSSFFSVSLTSVSTLKNKYKMKIFTNDEWSLFKKIGLLKVFVLFLPLQINYLHHHLYLRLSLIHI